MNNGWLLCIGAGAHQTAVLQEARKMGFYTLAVDINPAAPGRSLADDFLCHSAWDAKGIFKRIPEKIKPRVRGVVTQAARGCTLTAALLGKWLSLPHLNPDTAALFLDKERALCMFNESNATVFEVASQIPDGLELPCVLKGLTTSGGLGNHLVQTQAELQQLKSIPGRVVVEPFVQGRHLGIVGIKDTHQLYLYGIIERFLKPDMTVDKAVFPGSLDESTVKQVTDFTQHVLKTSAFNFGPFQLELIYQPDRHIHFVELEPSILGSYISEWMIPATGSGNMIADAINMATNTLVNWSPQLPQDIAYNKYYYADDPYIRAGGPWPDVVRIYGNTLQPANPRQYVANALISADSVEIAENLLAHLESNSIPTCHDK